MLRGLIVGAGTALGLSALLIVTVSLIVPSSGEFPAAQDGAPAAAPAPNAAPAPPAMAEREETAPSRPEALPARRTAPPAAAGRAPDPAGTASPSEAAEASTGLAIPSGSQFNRPREDFQPVAPRGEQVPRGVAQGPSSRPDVEGPVAAPAPDTSTAGAPSPGFVVVEVAPPAEGRAPARPAAPAEGVPRTFRDVVPVEEAAPAAPPNDPATVSVPAPRALETTAPGEEAPFVGTGTVERFDAPDPDLPAAGAGDLGAVDAAPVSSDAPVAPVARAGSAAPMLETRAAGRPEGSVGDRAGAGRSPFEAASLPVEAEPSAPPAEGRPVRSIQAPDAAAPSPGAGDGGPAPDAPEALTVGAFQAPAADGPVLPGAGEDDSRPSSAAAPAVDAPERPAQAAASLAPSRAPAVLERIAGPTAAPGTEVVDAGPTPDATATLVQVPVEPVAPEAEPEVEPAGTAPRRIVLDSERRDVEVPAPAPEPDADEAEGPAADPRAVAVNAEPFENPEGKPLFSVVLIDDAAGGVSRDDLVALDLPVTFAVDPARPGAAEAAAAYRAAGREVLLLADALPAGGAAQDVEVALAGALAEVPGAVGVLDGARGGFVRDREALGALLPALSDEGLGLLAYGGGLNSGLAAAERAGVPADSVYRVVDGAGERATVIARFLDRATFEAAQQGRVIVVGRTRPETVRALRAWAAGRRSDSVAVAPISHLLRAGEGGS